MYNIQVTFHKCIQDSQDYGSNDEHMVSRLFLTIEVHELLNEKETTTKYDNIYTDIKQMVGGKFEEDPIEVSPPYQASGELYKGPMNYDQFRKESENYFRKLVGNKGQGINIQGGSNIRMRNNVFIQEYSTEFKVSDTNGAW
jgi:hypothetical protein